MNRKTELRRILNQLNGELVNAYRIGDLDKAESISNDIAKHNNELSALEEKEANEPVVNKIPTSPKNQPSVKRVFNQLLKGHNLTEDEQRVVNQNNGWDNSSGIGQQGDKPDKGGYLLPQEYDESITEYKRSLVSLKPYTNVVSVSTREGGYAVAGDNKLELTEFTEFGQLDVKDLTFGQKKWSMKDYGLLLPIANQLIDDATADIVGFASKEFAKASVRTENKVILALLKKCGQSTSAVATDADIYNVFKETINVKIIPDLKASTKLYCNQTVFNYLDTVKDLEGNYILQPDIHSASSKTLFGAYEIVVIPNDVLADPTVYIGDMKEYIDFNELAGYEIALSREAGFKNYATWLRIVQRFDCALFDDKAMFKCDFTTVLATNHGQA